MTIKYSKSQIEKIKNYKKEIVTITDYKEAVRRKPGQYIGPIGSLGFLNMTREILQNSLDEIIKGNSIDKIIFMYYDENTNKVSIQDSGRGIPFGEISRTFTSEHTSSNYESVKGVYSSGNHGEGAKVTNVLSSFFSVESHILGQGRLIKFNEFIPWKEGEKVIKVNKDDFQQGTRIVFTPCYEVLGKISVSIDDILYLVKKLVPLTPIGTTVIFTGKRLNGKMYEENVINKKGLLHFVEAKTPLIKPIRLFDDNGTTRAEIIFTYDSSDLQAEQIRGFANFCPASGTHINGTIDGLCKYFRDYMNKIYLSSSNNSKKKEKLSIINSDIKTGLKIAVSAAHINPIFTGQAKETLSNEDMYYFTKNLVKKGLDEWVKANPKELNYVCSYLKGIAKIRVKAEEGKVKLSNNYKKSALSDYPAKYEEPTGKNNLELIIVEGDSAGGQAKRCRIPERQGIMPIKGKIPNAFSTLPRKFLENDEISGLIVIIGGGDGKNYLKKFDIKKVPFEKIIIMPDADPDGAHIRSLVLGFFMLYMPELIIAGKVFAAVPPLFSIKLSKDKYKYFIERMDYIEYIEKLFVKNNTVKNIRGEKLTNSDVSKILYDNEEYVYDMDIVSHRYAINPYALELILMHMKEPIENTIKDIKKHFRFAEFSKINGIWVLEGNINRKIHKVFLNNQFYHDCQPLYNKYMTLDQDMYYVLNDNIVSLYKFILEFNEAKPKKNFIRYKGLGEMESDQLGDSTMNPDSPYGRTLIQYTMESAEHEIDRAKYLNNNKREFIKDIKETRIVDLIG